MAMKRRDKAVRLLGFVRRNRAALLMSTALQATAMLVLSLPAEAQPAPNARPAGGAVTAGSAAISYAPGNTRIDQATQRAAINWQSFNVGSQQSVTFQQPSSSAVALNRVVGPDPSRIAGRIDANGQIVLTNQSGVTFYKGAQVNTNGLMVTAVGITNQNFMAGKMIFDQPAKPNARVENQGTITVRQAGLAALVAPQVVNSGVITAKLGHVVLAGARTATLDLYGDGLLSLDVSNQVAQAPVGPDGEKVTALVTNSGVIVADGGTVQLTARAADGVVQNLVEAGGKIRAATMGEQTGTIALNGVGGAIVVAGQLAATGNAAGTRGGAIEVVSNGNVGITSSARINASGKAGGGVVAIGTTLDRARGGPGVTPAMTAAKVTVQHGAKIAANATSNGDGGRITVLSGGTTVMNGLIAAKGGAGGGNGGFIEISGENLGMTTGQADVSTPLGNVGTILLDPRDLDIVATGTNNGDAGSSGVSVGSPNQNTDITVSGSVLTSLTGNLLIEASRDLTVDTPLSFVNQTTGNTVTMLAGNNLTVNQAINIRDGALTLRAAVQTDGVTTFTHFNTGGALTINASVGGAGAGPITLSAGTGGIKLNGNVSGSSIDLTTTGGGVAQSSGVIATATLQSTGGVVGDTTLMQTTNAVDTIGSFNVKSGNFALSDNAALSVTGKLSAAGNIYLQTADVETGLSVPGTIVAGATAIAGLQADRIGITGTLTAGTAELAPNTPSAVTLGGTGGLELSKATLGNISANLLRIGAVTIPGTGLTPTANAISIAGTIDLAGIATTLDLQSTGNVTEQAGAALQNVGTLTGTSTGLDITQAGNTIAQVGSYAVGSGGDFKLQTGRSLAVTGPLSANHVVLHTTGGGSSINVSGAINGTTSIDLNSGSITLATGADVAAPTVTLTGTNGISLTGNAVLGATGAVIDLTSSAGGVVEDATATLDAATLQSSGGVAGDVSLLGINHIAGIGAFATGGNFALKDQSALTVAGTLTATGNVYLEDSGGGITIGATGAVAAGSISRASFQAASLTIDPGGTITGGLFEFAPDTPGTVTLGAGGSLPSLAGVGTGSAEIGGVTIPGTGPGTGFTITATAITTIGTFDGNNLPVALNTTGAITEGTNDPIINIATLTGGGQSVSLTNSANSIADLGPFMATAGDFALVNAGDLSVIGAVSAATGAVSITANAGAGPGNLTISAPVTAGSSVALTAAGDITDNADVTAGTTATLTAGGSVTQNAGTISASDAVTVIANGGTIDQAAGREISTKTGGAISLTASSDILFGGTLTTGNSGSVSLSSHNGRISETIPGETNPTGTILTGTLTGSAAANASLIGTNAIGTLGAFSTGTGFALVDNEALTVAGPVIDTGLASAVALTTLNGDITLDGNVAASTIDLISAGAVNQAGGVLNAGTLIGSAVLSASLTEPGNQIATIGTFTTGGDFALKDQSALTVAGALTATGNIYLEDSGGGITIGATGAVAAGGTSRASFQAAGLTIDAGGTITGGLFEFAPDTPGTVTLGGALPSLAGVGTGSAEIGGVTIPGTGPGTGFTITATAITTIGTFDGNNLPVALNTTGAITEGTNDPIINIATLTGGAASVDLIQPGNLIHTLGSFNTTSGFALVDGEALTVIGTLSDTGTAAVVALTTTSGDITLNGTINAAGDVMELFSAGTITEATDAAVNAAQLMGSAAASANLIGTNAIGTLSNFTAATSFALDDTSGLTVNGPVTANTVALSASSIDIAGAVTGTVSVALNAKTGITEEGGITTALLTGSVVSGGTSLIGTNAIGTLGTFNTTAGFDLKNGQSLTVAGLVTDTGTGSTVTLDVISGDLILAGTVSASAGVVDLIAENGAITQIAGALITATLTGSATGAATLNQPGVNQIGTIADFIASGFTLDNNPNLTISGTLNGGPSVSVTDGGAVTITPAGVVTANAIALTATDINIGGVVTAGSTGSVSLIANGGNGTIGETGSLIAATLSGQSNGATSLTGINQVGTLTGFTAASFALNDSIDLSITGLLNGGAVVALQDNGSINETGTLIAGVLQGSAGATANFLGATPTTNQIATLGSFTAGGSFTLDDGGPLTITGPMTSPTIVLTAPSLDIAGAVNGSTSVTLTATSGGITEETGEAQGSIATALLTGSAVTSVSLNGNNAVVTLGAFSANGGFSLVNGEALTVAGPVTAGTVALTTTAGDLTRAGNVTGGAIDLFSAGAIDQTAGALTANTLTGSAVGAATLTQPANQIATVSNFTASGFALDDNQSLTVSGTLNGGANVTVLDNGTLTIGIGGTVIASAIALTAANIDIAGTATDPGAGTVSLIANAGTIGETGAIIAGTLSGSSVGATTLTGTNQIGTLGNFAAAGFALNDTINLLIAGVLNGGPSVAIQDGGAISETGAILAGTLTGSAAGSASFTGANQIGMLGNFTANGFALNNGVDLTIAGVLNSGAGVTLQDAGTINETGVILTNLLSGSATGAASFSSGGNQIASLGNFSASGFTLNDSTNLAVDGAVNGGPSATFGVTGSLTLNGALNASTVSLTANGGAISGMGQVIANLLTGRATGDATLNGPANHVAELNNFSAGGTFTLDDAINLTIAGTLNAPKIVVNDGTNRITLADNATIVTGGTKRPPGVVRQPPNAATSPGAFLTAGSFAQLGTSFVQGSPSILEINVSSGGGNVSFSTASGLRAPNTWLVLVMGSGQATGNVQVANLDVFRQSNAGSTSLFGSVATLSGVAAAGVSGIQPSPNTKFQFNACPIQSVNCVLLPTAPVPTANPLNDISIGTLYNPDEQDELLLPIVTDQEY
jgi:filamentous hemagglutinin family protein